MKKINVISILILAMTMMMNVTIAQGTFGKKVDEKKAITMQDLQTQMKDKTELETTVTGKVFRDRKSVV